MNAQALAKTAYGSQAQALRTPRRTEFEAFARITKQLRDAARVGRAHFPLLAKAVHENRRLWTLLASNVAQGDNALPPELRARIFYLADFTFQHSARVLRREALPDVLIEINVAVMRGLGAEARP